MFTKYITIFYVLFIACACLDKYIVYLNYNANLQNFKRHCAGVLIGKNAVLTAASCIKHLDILEFDETETTFSVITRNNKTVMVKYSLRHPEFNSRSYEANIAVLILAEDLHPILDDVNILSLPTQKARENVPCIMADWHFHGVSYILKKSACLDYVQTMHDFDLCINNSTLIRQSSVSIKKIKVDNGTIADELNHYYQNQTSRMRRQLYERPSKLTASEPCEIRNGAPVVCNGDLTALVSVKKCGRAGPSLFPSVYKYSGWITYVTGELRVDVKSASNRTFNTVSYFKYFLLLFYVTVSM